MKTKNKMNQEIVISFEHIKDHYETIAEIIKLEKEYQKGENGANRIKLVSESF